MTDATGADHLAEDVAALLDWLLVRLVDLPPERRNEATANILLNALLSVLEEVRRTAPERYGAYVRMSVLMLGDD